VVLDFRDMSKSSEAGETEAGFTMLELLIIIAILGILAATIIFSLSGLTVSAAQASCKSDATSVEVAVQAFHENPNNTAAANQFPTSPAQLTDPASDNFGGPYLHSWPDGTNYTITLDATNRGQVDVNGRTYDGSTNPCSSIP
jgi:prepilin-type N-terminal cleavage/methylation domain-containing protein